MAREVKKVLRVDEPGGRKACLVADSPHSGCEYPDDFGYSCDFSELRKAEDAGVDSLYGFFPGIGVPFLQAQFPRSYIDANRRDTVTQRFKEGGDGPYHPSMDELLRDWCTPRSEQKIYDRAVGLKEAFNRVAGYYQPYHDELARLLDETQAEHGKVVHLNCHSMPSVLRHGKDPNPWDVAIGTRDGKSCAPEIAERLKQLFEEKGYKTGLDVSGFRGREILRRAGDPGNGRHSIQIEINRGLYMDEDTVSPSPGAAQLRADLKDIMTEFAAWCDALPAQKPKPSPAAKPPAPSSGG